MKISVKKIFLLLFIFFFLNGFFRSPYVPKLDRDNMSYKRDIELVLEYEGKEYKLNSTIQCIDKKVYWGWGGGVPTGELVIHWKSTITNNKLTLPGGEELEMINFFKYGEKRFYSDEYVEEFKKKLEKFYDKKTGYYYNKINSKYRLEGFGTLLKNFDLDSDENIKLKLKLRMKNYKISKRY